MCYNYLFIPRLINSTQFLIYPGHLVWLQLSIADMLKHFNIGKYLLQPNG